jgi:hypothetical protein
MSFPPGALELMSYGPLLGRCRKPPDFVQSPTRHRLQRADPKKAVCSWADVSSGRRPFRARALKSSLVGLEAHAFATAAALLSSSGVKEGEESRPKKITEWICSPHLLVERLQNC